MDSLDRIHHVLVIEDPSFHREINLDAATYSIGRHSSNDIVLSCQKTSRNHATLLRRTDVKTNKFSYWVLDGDLQGNRSRNGIYINGKKTLVHELKDRDVIQFSGDARATYKISAERSDCEANENQAIPQDFSSNSSRLPIEHNTIINKDTIVTPVPATALKDNSKTILPDSSQQISLAELSPQPIIEIDLYGNITYINSAGIINFRDIHHRKLNHPLLENLISIYHQGKDNIVNREVKVDDKVFWQTAHYLPDNKVIRNYLVDITRQKTLEAEVKRKADIYSQISKHINDGVILVESSTKQIIEANYSCSELLGYSSDRLLQMNIYEVFGDSENFSAILQGVIAEKNSFAGECLLRRHDGEEIKARVKINSAELKEKEIVCLIINSSQLEQQKNIEAVFPANISQKEIFEQQTITAIANAKRSDNLMAIVLCKLYFLPDIRENLGIQKSRDLLTTLGKRLSYCVRSGDTVIHWEDDKYALLMPQMNGIEEIAKINSRIKQSVEQSFKLGATKVTLNSCIGVAVYPQDGTNSSILLANANTALERAYQSKSAYQFYNESMNSQALVALELELLLKQGLKQEEFKLYYQPQIDVSTGKTKAIEALLRWQHPEFGLVSPNNFIKSAETTQLIVPIGEWAIRQACIQGKAWQKEGFPPLRITVSLSSVQFQQANLASKIADILAETGLESQLLELEINAVSLLENIEHSRTTLKHLKELGVCLAVDNFTAGFSILEYLKHFPLDTLKIDKTLVQQLDNSPQDIAIVTALIELGKGFNLRVVAEGIENQKQVDLLTNLDCQQMQGFWFGRPLEASEASKLLSIDDLDTTASVQASKTQK